MDDEDELSPDAIMTAKEIHRRMVQKGFNKTSLAIAAGVGRTYVRDLFEARSTNPKSAHLEKIAAALGCSVTDLTNPGSEPTEPSQNVVDFSGVLPLRGSEIPLIRMWRILGDTDRNYILGEMVLRMRPAKPRKQDNI